MAMVWRLKSDFCLAGISDLDGYLDVLFWIEVYALLGVCV